ncbi:uncharacterized protein BCR38DRAFT_346822 [Pseudomassariella vexata]|uniref:UspA domain-containing protein n=1 Tax=Pseudomassariella vexata TaxID=1141098 RepID=A0A1Y2DTN1_9PEZI|nr:uncharacterized protein BCR38DRAFT_346822 [Pseudomassariella vexata]ORY62496.1 hypothetical protein BCR38DRAFT_346822 [Pseudomassariella vexata]
MSLEAALEEERQQIEELLQQSNQSRGPPSIGSARSPSPFMSSRSPVRSMLDIGETKKSPPQAPYRSMLDLGGPPAPSAPRRSMLDIAGAPAQSAPSSAQTSPILTSHRASLMPQSSQHHRSMSDAASKPVDFGPRSPPIPRDRNNDPTAAYQFSDIYATNVGQALPGYKRSSQTGGARSSSIGDALRGELSNLTLPGDGRKQSQYSLRPNSKSKSPSNRFSVRSSSPGGGLLGNRNRNELSGTMMLDNGTVIDMNNAYRRLSDANLIYGSPGLASYTRKKAESEGHGRLEKSNMSPYGELLPDDDSDDDVANTSDEEDHRGRKLTTRGESSGDDAALGGARTAKSLLAAAEDERKQVAAQPQYRSLFEPEITVTSPTGERKQRARQFVQPATSFDQEPHSGSHTPLDLELESSVSAIKHAQKLEVTSTPIINTPEVHRSIRIIFRGEYNRIQRDAEEEHRRLRKYVVATDLSDESTHALEWAIGTVLRDGDTLIAIYCMDEEATGSADPASQVPDDPKSMREQAAAINAMTKNAKIPQRPGSPNPFNLHLSAISPYVRSAEGGSATPSPAPSLRGKSRTEEERERAVQDITDRVSKLLRKTQLQVRVIVECIHCKNPKHLITEVIDLVSPTLVILGSRGRSALKGTLLGSFSNYLVTKSSVPVMVARKRLRKKSKYQPPPMKQVNNLANPAARSLEMARID